MSKFDVDVYNTLHNGLLMQHKWSMHGGIMDYENRYGGDLGADGYPTDDYEGYRYSHGRGLRSSDAAGSYSRSGDEASDHAFHGDIDAERYSRSSYGSRTQSRRSPRESADFDDTVVRTRPSARDADDDSLERYSRSSYSRANYGGRNRGYEYAEDYDDYEEMLIEYEDDEFDDDSEADYKDEHEAKRGGALEEGRESARDARRRARAQRAQEHRGADHEDGQSRVRESYSRTSNAYSAKRSRGKRKWVVVVVVVVALILAGAGAAFAYLHNVSSNLNEGVDQDLRDALVQTDMAKEPFYVLLLGTDQSADRDGDEEFGGVYRSDSMILARIDPVQKKVALVSIPRDTVADLGPEYGMQKINAARAFGGPALAVQAVSNLTGVKISHYAEINFDGFADAVDALGGVEIDVPMDIDDEDAYCHLSAGVQVLNGEQALALCRVRNAYADISAAPDVMRAANQRMVLSAIAKKLLASDILTIANTVQSVSKYVTTDLAINDIVGIAQIMQGLDTETDMYTASLPTDSYFVVGNQCYADMNSSVPLRTLNYTLDDGWYLFIDDQEWTAMRKRLEKGESPSETTEVDEATGVILSTNGKARSVERNATVVVKNGTNRSGLAADTVDKLKEAGFKNATIGDIAQGYAYPETLIIYNDAPRAQDAEEIVKILGQGTVMQNDGSYLLDGDFLVVIGDDWKDDDAQKKPSS